MESMDRLCESGAGKGVQGVSGAGERNQELKSGSLGSDNTEPGGFQKKAQRAGPARVIHLTYFRDLRSRPGSWGHGGTGYRE